MGFGDDADKLVVITDGSDQVELVAFWRDQIPGDSVPEPGARVTPDRRPDPGDRRTVPVPKFIQSEQSVVVNYYGAFVVNNIRPEGDPDRLVDVLAGGPVLEPPHGMQRFEWDPAATAGSRCGPAVTWWPRRWSRPPAAGRTR